MDWNDPKQKQIGNIFLTRTVYANECVDKKSPKFNEIFCCAIVHQVIQKAWFNAKI